MTVLLDYPDDYTQKLDPAQIENIVLATLAHQGKSVNADLTIVITDDEQLHQLNRKFLGIDTPTDVLAFPAGHTDPDTDRAYVGDVIISYPMASRQAQRAGHSISDEILLLVVHGILHLLGHDHHSSDEQSTMWTAQNEILASIELDINMPDTSNTHGG